LRESINSSIYLCKPEGLPYEVDYDLTDDEIALVEVGAKSYLPH